MDDNHEISQSVANEFTHLGCGKVLAAICKLAPVHMREGVALYLLRGVPPGDFLLAVLSGDLFEAVNRADKANKVRLPDFVQLFQTYAPAMAYGSQDKVRAWCSAGGMKGLYDSMGASVPPPRI